jgi:hypothetical protein
MKIVFQLPVNDDVVQKCSKQLTNKDQYPEIIIEPSGPQNAVEWALPAALVIIFEAARSSFLDGFFEELGMKDFGKRAGRRLAKKLTNILETLTTVERHWTKGSREINAKSPRSPLLRIVQQRRYDIGSGKEFDLLVHFIFLDIVTNDDMQAALCNANDRLEIINRILEESRRDIIRAPDVSRLYIGQDRPDIASSIALNKAQTQSRTLGGYFVFDVQERRWVKVH